MIRPSAPEDFAAFFPPVIEARTLLVDGTPMAIGILTRREDGRLWMALDVKPGIGAHALGIVRATREVLSRQSEPVFAPGQVMTHPEAPRLLALIGFEETDEVFKNIAGFSEGCMVWKWTPWA